MTGWEQFKSVYFGFGILVVWFYARKRFNEPSFPSRANFPHTLEPLRYFFLGPGYLRARRWYVVASLILYAFLVLPGPKVIQALGVDSAVPPEGWPLLMALFLVGFVPSSRLRWLEAVEEGLRGFVHRWFLVPKGIDTTIGILEDAPYDPPWNPVDPVAGDAIAKLRDTLRSRGSALRHRWARAQMLMIALNEMGPEAAVPLRRAAFEPFQEDWEAIRGTYRSLEKELGAPGEDPDRGGEAENAKDAVDRLLGQIYRYISWGIWYQANNEREVGETLLALGFLVPQAAGRHLFDIVAPPVTVVAAVTVVFWVIVLGLTQGTGPAPGSLGWPMIVFSAAFTGLAAAAMYGGAVFLALRQRSVGIERKAWREGSPKSLFSVARTAGAFAWAVIAVTSLIMSMILQPDVTWQSLSDLFAWIAHGRFLSPGGASVWNKIPVMVLAGVPWMLAGAAVGTGVARSVGRNVWQLVAGGGRRSVRRQRAFEALALACWLGLAAAVAQMLQTAINTLWAKQGPGLHDELISGLTIGVVGALCGAIIGWAVPYSCRENLVTPPEPEVAGALGKLIDRARAVLGGKDNAEKWVFSPHAELNGITPAEAVRYQQYASGLSRLLAESGPRRSSQGEQPGNGQLTPVVNPAGREYFLTRQ